MISLDLMKSSEVRIAGDRSNSLMEKNTILTRDIGNLEKILFNALIGVELFSHPILEYIYVPKNVAQEKTIRQGKSNNITMKVESRMRGSHRALKV